MLEAIKTKYGYDTKMLLLHYTAVSGEISTDFIKHIGVSQSNMQYVFYQSSFKSFFKCYRLNAMCGYQINGLGMDYLFQNYLKLYDTFLFNSNYNRRRLTKEAYRRRRFRSSAYLYFFLDCLNIDYLHKDNENIYFIPSQLLKNGVLLSDLRIKQLNREEHQIKSSKIMGSIVCGTQMYNIYVFLDDLAILEKATEFRTSELLNAKYRYELGKANSSVKTVIFTRNITKQEKIAKRIIDIKLSKETTISDKYSFYKEFDFDLFSELYIIPMDEYGEKETKLLLQRDATERLIHNQLSSYKKEPPNKLGISCDCYISEKPAIFLYALDLIKLIQFYNSLTIRGLQGYIFCLPHHESIVRNLFIKDFESIMIISLEM